MKRRTNRRPPSGRICFSPSAGRRGWQYRPSVPSRLVATRPSRHLLAALFHPHPLHGMGGFRPLVIAHLLPGYATIVGAVFVDQPEHVTTAMRFTGAMLRWKAVGK